MNKKISRRQAIIAISSAVLLPTACTKSPEETTNKPVEKPTNIFLHGIASGDPDQTSVVIWTRVSNLENKPTVKWMIALDANFAQTIQQGVVTTDSDRDYTVKKVISDLVPGQQYYYKFETNDVTSSIGQTKTLPIGHVDNLTLALATCANFPFGYFNAYDAIAKDASIDIILHLGDYIYEYGVDGYGGEHGKKIGRNHIPEHEILNLDDYRQRHAQYKNDIDSQAMHARHPLIVIWDDHETANNPWMNGASNHQENEGNWHARRKASMQAYYEWLPIRDPKDESDRVNYWRHYKFGDLASIITLESRHAGRSEQINLSENLPKLENADQAKEFYDTIVAAPERNMLSDKMQEFLKVELKESKSAGRRWRIIANSSVMAKSTSPRLEDPILDKLRENLQGKAKAKMDSLTLLGKLDLPADLDMWDGYPVARENFYQLAKDAGVNDLLVVSGDSHSYWANELYADDGQSMGVELGSTGLSSPRSIMKELGPAILKRYDELNNAHNKELIWSDGRHRGYIKLQINHAGSHADFIAVSNVDTREYVTNIIHSVDIVNSNGMLSYKK